MRVFVFLLIVFCFKLVVAQNIQVFINSGITKYKNNRNGSSLEAGFEYFPFDWMSFGLSYEKFEAAYYEFENTELADKLNFVVNTSYALPKLNLNYYPLNIDRHKVKIGAYFTKGRLTSDRPSYFDLIEILNTGTGQNIVNVEYGIGDYIRQVNGLGFVFGYYYLIIPNKMNIGFLFDYTEFYPSFNTSYHFVPHPVSAKLSLAFSL